MTKKIEGVKDAFKILERRCKDQKKILDKTIEIKNFGYYWCFDDNGQSNVDQEQAKLDALVAAKIEIEKHMRKLKHEDEERRKNEPVS